jgi:hypothetical protein
MKKAVLLRLLLLAALAASTLSCGIVWTDPPTPTPVPTATSTATPIPPTETPIPTATPTETPSPVPTQSRASLLEALTKVKNGGSAPEAAAYEKSKAGVHPIFILAPDEEAEAWNVELPYNWQPGFLNKVELVASIRYLETKINMTRYRHPGESGWIFVTRYRRDTLVELFAAQTGEQIDSKIFQGGDPIPFPPYLGGGTTSLYGDDAPHDLIEEWLRTFVEK